MADSSVLLEVIVEGKNIKLVQRDVEELGASINKSSMATEKDTKQKKKNKKATEDLAAGTQNYNRGQKGVAQATANGTKAFSKQRDLIGGGSSGLVGAYATLAANLFAATAAFGTLQRAAQAEQLEKGLLALGAASGIALQSLGRGLREATDSAISLEQAFRSTTQIVSAGLDPSSVEEFGKAAKNISVALGRDVTDSLDRLTRGVSKLEPELLDELGLFIRVDEAAAKYAQQLGKASSQLTNFEKRIAFQNEALAQAEAKFGAIGDSVDVNPYDKLSASLADLLKTVTTAVSVVFEPLISFLSQNPIALVSVLGLLGRKVIVQVIDNLADLNKAFQANLATQKVVATQVSKQASAYIGQSKVLRTFRNELRQGNSTLETRNKVIKQQETLVKRQETKLRNVSAAVIAGEKSSRQLTNAENALTRAKERQAVVLGLVAQATAADTLRKAENTTATIINYIQQGKWRKALKLSGIALIRFKRGILGVTKGLKGLALVTTFTKVGFRALAAGAKVLGAALLQAIPIIGQIILLFTLIVDAVKGVINFFKSDETKRFEENLESLKDTQTELAGSLQEIDKAFEGTSRTILTTADAYTALSNSIAQFDGLYRKLGDAGNEEERLEQLNQFIDSSTIISQKTKEISGETLKLASTDKQRVKILEETLRKIQAQANAVRAVADAAGALSEALGNLRASYIETTPFTEVKGAIDELVRSAENAVQQGEAQNITAAILPKISQEDARDLGIGQIKEQFDKASSDIASVDKALIADLEDGFGGLFNRVFQRTFNRDEFNARQRKAKEEQAKLTEAEEDRENAINTSVEKQLESRRQLFKQLDLKLRTQKNIMAESKAELKFLNLININTAKGVKDRVTAINKQKQAQIDYNNILLGENTRRKEVLNQQAISLSNAYAQAKTDEERKGIQDQINNLIPEYNALNTERNRLDAENKTLKEEQVNADEESLMLAQAKLNALQAEQSYLTTALNVQKQMAASAAQERDSRLAIARSNREAARSVAGQGLTTSDELEFAKTAKENATAAANTEFGLAKARIDLEFALLDVKLAVLDKQLAVDLASGKISKEQYDNAKKALGNLDVQAAKRAAISAAEAKRDQTIAEASNAVTILENKLKREGEQRAIDAIKRRADIAEAAGAVQLAQSLREQALVMEREMTEADILALKEKGLSTVEKEVEAAERVNALIKERISGIDTKGLTGAGAAAVQGIEAIRITSEETDDPEVLAQAKAEATRNIMRGVAEDMKAIGPEGELMSSVVSGAMNIADAFQSAFQIIGNESASMGDKIQAGLAVAQTVMAQFSAISKAASDAKIRQIDQEIAMEKKRDGKSKESLAKIAKLEAKKEAAKKKAFETEKKMKIAQTIIGTAQGVTAMLGAAPPPFNFALAAAVGAMGLKQLQMIQSTSYQGGGSAGAGSASPPSLAVGERKSTVDLAKSQSASGELSYLRGAQGTGGPENFKPAFMGAKYRAMGGATAGYVVGEQGPELFVPSTPGTIVPNSEVSGGAPVNATFNINTIDASGVEEVLTGQRGNIIGMLRESANSYGNGFFEEVETELYGDTSGGMNRA